MAQVLGRKGVPEFMQEEVLAVRPLGTAIAMSREALTTVEFGPLGNTFYDHIVLAVRITSGIGEDQVRR